MSCGRPMTSSAPYSEPPAGALLSETVTAFDAPGASEKAVSLTASAEIVARRFGTTRPEEDCVQGRAETAMSSGCALLFETVTVFVAPTAIGRSIDTGEIASPRVCCAIRALGSSACAITAAPLPHA